MNTNYISKIYSGAIFSGILLLALFGISASNVTAAEATVTVTKDFCRSIGASNTCNGIPDAFPNNVTFTVETGTFDGTTFISTGFVSPIDVAIGTNANGSTTTGNVFTSDTFIRVCEVTPNSFVSIPRPGNSGGGQNQFGQENCLIVLLGPGNNQLKFINGPARPTAAAVTVRGRVLSPFGRGVSRALVSMTDSTGQTRTVRTNPFGFYTFGNIEVGATYILEVRAKRYTFTSQALSLTEEATDVNFTAQR